jgi:hypothetical protein
VAGFDAPSLAFLQERTVKLAMATLANTLDARQELPLIFQLIYLRITDTDNK